MENLSGSVDQCLSLLYETCALEGFQLLSVRQKGKGLKANYSFIACSTHNPTHLLEKNMSHLLELK